MSCRNIVSLLVAIAALAAPRPSKGGIAPLTQSMKIDKADGLATFTIDFSHTPDLTTIDSKGRPADSFQIEIAASPAPAADQFGVLTTVIRGDEIQFGGLPIRAASPPDAADPHSGGWGAVRGTIPYKIDGDTLSFSAPLSTLGVGNQPFDYRAFTLSYGVIEAQADSIAAPLPSGLAATLVMGVMALAMAGFKQLVAVRSR